MLFITDLSTSILLEANTVCEFPVYKEDRHKICDDDARHSSQRERETLNAGQLENAS